MLNYDRLEDTICAPATPMGVGGIGVLRVSGPETVEILRDISSLPKGELKSHQAYYVKIYNLDGDQIDEGLATYFQEGKSYTGSETIELSCHGNPLLIEQVLHALLSKGCRMAEKGEFTYRAFMSGNMDLIQAESVLALIESESTRSARISLRQLKGGLSGEISKLVDDTTHLLAHIEANIDFSQEGLESIEKAEIDLGIKSLLRRSDGLLRSYKKGKVLTKHFRVVFAGDPNVGKSSLFNLFVGSDRAIVTNIEGTTRDTIEGEKSISGMKFVFVDTAGIRPTENVIEELGIRKAWEEMEGGDKIFYVMDSTAPFSEPNHELLDRYQDRIMVLFNKNDLKSESHSAEALLKLKKIPFYYVNALDKKAIQPILDELEKETKNTFQENEPIVFKTRQFDLLKKANEFLVNAVKISNEEISPEFVSFELRSALESFLELVGKRYNDEVLTKVFQEFCVGK